MSVEAVIAQKFNLEFPTSASVMCADRAVLKHEIFTFFGGAQRYLEDFGEEYQPGVSQHILGFSPKEAEEKFLDLYWSLT